MKNLQNIKIYIFGEAVSLKDLVEAWIKLKK